MKRVEVEEGVQKCEEMKGKMQGQLSGEVLGRVPFACYEFGDERRDVLR